MKKVIFVVLTILFLFLSFISGVYVQKTIDNKRMNQLNIQLNSNLKEENNIEPENQYKDQIDLEEENCISNTDIYDYPLCSQKAEKAWDNEIQKNLELLKKLMSKEDFKYIIEMNKMKSPNGKLIMPNEMVPYIDRLLSADCTFNGLSITADVEDSCDIYKSENQ